MSDNSLDSVVTDYHIVEIADDLLDWELLAPYLELTEGEQKEISEDYRGFYKLQKQKALEVWQWRSGGNATYRNLSSICRSQGLIGLAEKIESYPGKEVQPRNTQLLHKFNRFLTDCYLGSPHPATLQWPDTAAPFSLPAPSTFCNIKLHEALLLEVQSSPRNPTPAQEDIKSVTLESVLSKGEGSQRMLVYFKGTGGSGKTTLSWHACREWAQKRLLTQFQLLIHVDLSHVKSATTFADLIAYPDSTLKQAIAEAIVVQKGLGVCLLLDGLDEAPIELLDVLLVDLLRGRLGKVQLPELSFVMTSRPDWRVTERLQHDLKSCIVLAGFNRESLFKFLDNSLGAASEEKAILLQEFKINPAVEGLCCHPVNAAIMSYVIHFIDKSKIPSTQTKLHELLIIHFLIRHFKSHAKTDKPCVIKCLIDDECLPKEICLSFRMLCQLAYTATVELKHLFSNDDLKQAEIQDTLGLLNTRPTTTMYGSKQYYSFYHISVQEFLAAVHLAVMEEGKTSTVSAVEQFLGNNLVKSQVLPFYAGLTNLSDIKAFVAISKSLSQIGGGEYIMTQELESDRAPMQRAVAFTKCLYECENEALMQSPETDLPSDRVMKQMAKEFIHKQFAGNTAIMDLCCNIIDNILEAMNTKVLFLTGIVLTPLDCLSLGHYIRTKHLNAISCVSRDEKSIPVLQISVTNCSIKEIGMCLLLTEMAKDVTECSPVKITLNLQGNQFDSESLLSLKHLLQRQINIEFLGVGNCLDPSVVDLGYAVMCITEGLANNRVCWSVDLSLNPFNASHIHHITSMLSTCSGLKKLTLTFNSFGSEAMSLFGDALALSSLDNLGLLRCNISDSELDLLGEKLQANSRLRSLSVITHDITPAGFCEFLCHFKTSTCSCLHAMLVPSNIEKHPGVQQIVKEINAFRSTLRHPPADLVIHSEKLAEQLLVETPQISSIHQGQVANRFQQKIKEVFNPS